MARLPQFSFETINQSLQIALNEWEDDAVVLDALGDLRLVQQQLRQGENEFGPIPLVRRLILDCLASMEEFSEDQATAIKMRYIEGDTLQSIATDLQSSVATAKRRSENSVERLAKILYSREKECRDAELHNLRILLPPQTYDELVGQEETVEAIVEELVSPGSPWVLAVVGVGGIGKSAVADAVVRRALETFHFERGVWIRNDQHSRVNNPLTMSILVDVMQRQLEQSLYGRLISSENLAERREVWNRLKEKPYLVVIDNVETEADTLMLMEFLRYASNPTKFVITCRSRLLLNSGIYHYPLGELSFENSHRLLADFSRKLGPFPPDITPAISRKIYDRVGGNPLALKLVANLLNVWPLDQILSDFAAEAGKSEREIYRPIYLRVWRILTPAAQRVLTALGQLPAEGGRPVDIMRLGSLSNQEFWDAVEELTDRSLIEVRGTIEDRLYGIHRLTQAFLETGLMEEG